MSSLLKTVKAVEDIHTRGAQAMAGTITAIDQEIRVNNFIPQKKNSCIIHLSLISIHCQHVMSTPGNTITNVV